MKDAKKKSGLGKRTGWTPSIRHFSPRDRLFWKVKRNIED